MRPDRRTSATASILGVNLRKCRASLGLSQAELARRCGVSRPAISSIEQGRGNPTLSVIDRACAALGVRPTELLKPPAQRLSAARAAYSRAGRKPSFRNWLLHPPPGSKTAAARDFGVDLSLLIENLSLTLPERVRKMEAAASTIAALRRAMRTKAHGRS